MWNKEKEYKILQFKKGTTQNDKKSDGNRQQKVLLPPEVTKDPVKSKNYIGFVR